MCKIIILGVLINRFENSFICVYIFFYIISCLKYYIDFNIYFFYSYNFDTFVYSCCIYIIFFIISYFLSYFNYFFILYYFDVVVLYLILPSIHNDSISFIDNTNLKVNTLIMHQIKILKKMRFLFVFRTSNFG